MTLKDTLNDLNVNEAMDELRRLNMGDLIRSLPISLLKKTAAASASQLSTVQSIALPGDAKCAAILRAVARAGTGTLGELSVNAANATPGAHTVSVAPNGDIALLAADAYTSVDVLYVPHKCKPVTLTLPVVSNVLTFPTQYNVLGIDSATSLVGTLTGAMIVLAPSASAPATTKVCLSADHLSALFAVADAVTSATVTFFVASDVDVNAMIQASFP